ncbi:PREDICTED: protein ELC-like [Tarenaya hassleriana]|uniref:protein ELC-like n=1 Tax=Tarenaya hassleriana TaxID=28532 RepID=UPI00053C1C41|nr:PREDICTED: protein ELC-like [Tarenaya hassleriana]
MASPSPTRFIEKALLAAGPFALSYTDPDQKWLIRKHLISFLQDFPNFELSTDTFNHNDGTAVHLFHLQGSLRIRNSILQLTPVELTIWVHENYPLTPPLVFVNPNSAPIRTNHPFVDASGFTNSTYIETWEHPRCNLLDLVRNLSKVFANDHPFVHTDSIPSRSSSASRTEALDRLATNLHYDILAITEEAEEDIENLWKLQTEMRKRSDSVAEIIRELETEKIKLNENVKKVKYDAGVLETWVKTNYPRFIQATSGDLEIEEMFELECDKEDEEAVKMVEIESSTEDDAIEDVMRALEEAVEKGDLEMGSYLRHVRVLAREQFFHRERNRSFFPL